MIAPRPCSLLALLLVLGACRGAVEPVSTEVAQHVDPFIGTGGVGHTFPGAVRPWGLASPSPHNLLSGPLGYFDGQIAPSGYRHGEPAIMGFGQTHMSGVGCPDLGAPVLVPVSGDVRPDVDSYASAYSQEDAGAGWYRVYLDGPDVEVSLTATQRVGVHRFTWHGQSDPVVQIDVGHGPSWVSGQGQVEVLSPTEVAGSVGTGKFCFGSNAQRIYFVARFSESASEAGVWKDGVVSSGSSAEGEAGAWMRFDGESVTVAVGVSLVDLDGARANLDAEWSGDFDATRDAAMLDWDAWLGRVRVEGGSDADRVRLYTALYHSLIHPSIATDVDGRARSFGDREIIRPASPRYTVFSLWDTYRSVHPLLALLYPKVQLVMARSLAEMTAESGRPPLWELAGHEVQVMVGDPTAIVLADSVVKGLHDFDVAGTLSLLEAAAVSEHRPGGTVYSELGYVPMEDEGSVWGPASTTLEYNLADFALAQLADHVGADGAAHRARAASWRTLYDAQTRVLRPRMRDGSWLEPFDPDAAEGSSPWEDGGGPGYVEGTAWQYAFFVPHEFAALAELRGVGRTVDDLQMLFDTGRFEMWNEPDMAYPYLFTYFEGEQWRTQEQVRVAMQRHFTTRPDGLPGNDDAGTLSAWFVFSALGLYPDAPGTDRYSLGSPLFTRVQLDLPGGAWVVDAPGNGDEAVYVRTATLNGQALGRWFLRHGELAGGGTLALEMASSPP